MENTKFEVGTVYCMGSAGYKIIKRTEKSVWVQGYGRKSVSLDDRGVEWIQPEGRNRPRLIADRNEGVK